MIVNDSSCSNMRDSWNYHQLSWPFERALRDIPQTKLVSEIKSSFSLNEHGDPHFLFYIFNENNIRNNWEKKLAEIYGYFFGQWNKCNR